MKSMKVAFVSDTNRELGSQIASQLEVPFLSHPMEGAALAKHLIIATSSESHYKLTNDCLGHFDAIFVEKPLTLDSASSRALMDSASKSRTSIQVGFIERFNPAVQSLRRALLSRPNPTSLEFRRVGRLANFDQQVDVIRDLMIHDIDLALVIAGPIDSIEGLGINYSGAYRLCHALARHRSGTVSHFCTSHLSQRKQRWMRVGHEQYAAEVDLMSQSLVISELGLVSDPDAGEFVSTSVEHEINVNRSEPLLDELRVFLYGPLNSSIVSVPGCRDALEAIQVCEHLLKDLKE
jgi:predicted dehydrogenase